MPSGIYERTDYHKKIAKENSSFKKGFTPWNKGKHPKYVQGKNHPMYGIRRLGKESPNWRGGKRKHKNGYVEVKSHNHLFANYDNYVYEHRLVMEKHLGRYLKPEEVVHHRNEIKNDNRIENLKLFKNESEHQRFHNKK